MIRAFIFVYDLLTTLNSAGLGSGSFIRFP